MPELSNQELLEYIQFAYQDLRGRMDEHNKKLKYRIEQLVLHVDSFIQLHKTLDLELAAIRSKTERLEERIECLEKGVV